MQNPGDELRKKEFMKKLLNKSTFERQS